MIDPARQFIRIALADDHAIVREGYRRLLERCLDFRIVGEAAGSEELMTLAQTVTIDVLILDISMPGLSGIEVTRRLSTKYPTIAVLISSMHEEPIFAKRALEAGALGYVTKSSDPDALISAIRRVATGQRYLSAEIATSIALEGTTDKLSPELSPKEFEILRRIVQGHSLDLIAQSMALSPKTVANYQSSIKQKLNVDSNAQLFRIAANMGLIAPPPDNH